MKLGAGRGRQAASQRASFEVRHDPSWDTSPELESIPRAGVTGAARRVDIDRLGALEDQLRRAVEAQAALAQRVEQLASRLEESLAAMAPAPRRRAATPAPATKATKVTKATKATSSATSSRTRSQPVDGPSRQRPLGNGSEEPAPE